MPTIPKNKKPLNVISNIDNDAPNYEYANKENKISRV